MNTNTIITADMTPEMRFEAYVDHRLQQTKESAERRGKDFNLTRKYIVNILKHDVCAYSGEKFSKRTQGDRITFERWDNNKGYVIGNVIPVKFKYNTLRGSLELDQLNERATKTARQIVRGLDKKSSKAYDTKINALNERIASITKNIKKRKHTLAGLNKFENPNKTILEQIASLEVRIKGGIAEVENSQRLLRSMTKGGPSSKLSIAEEKVISYGIIAKGLSAYENQTWIQRCKTNRGLQLNCSLFTLIKDIL